MVIQNTIIDLLIDILITAGVYLTLVLIVEYVRDCNDKKDKKKTVEAEATVDKETAVPDYEDGHYEGDMD